MDMPELKILFVDRNPEFIRIVGDTFAGCPNVLTRCVECVSECAGYVCDKVFVSPANSLGFMDGGIDYAYSRKMFPDVERCVRDKIKSLGILSGLGRHYLPIGSAIAVDVGPTTKLISAPTMFLPQNVCGTRNAYHAFMACLVLFHRKMNLGGSHTLVCPALCTGVGRMDNLTSAKQMHDAYTDYCSSCVPDEIAFKDDATVFISESKDPEQPMVYDNREIRPGMSTMSYINAVRKNMAV